MIDVTEDEHSPDAWEKHRLKQRGPASKSDGPPHPMVEALGKLRTIMDEARQLRKTLKTRFGLTDYQIDTMSDLTARAKRG